MILSDFSIRRPVFAWMLMAALIVFGGCGAALLVFGLALASQMYGPFL